MSRDYDVTVEWRPDRPNTRSRKTVIKTRASSERVAMEIAARSIKFERSIPGGALIRSMKL